MSVRVAILDSGIFAAHPAVGMIAGCAVIVGEDITDHIGHGTAVAATIRRLAPHAEIYVVKIFDRSLACPIGTLLSALDWAVQKRMDLVNMSLGTSNPAHRAALEPYVSKLRIVAPAGSLPGDLDGVERVSGTARAGSLEGVSFAVAERTGELAARMEGAARKRPHEH